MHLRHFAFVSFLAVLPAISSAHAQTAPIPVVAAENFYGDIASQIGGPLVAVTSILTNPDQDPHLFEASTETARLIASAKVVIASGADYDPWMATLLKASPAPGRSEINVADLVGRKSGDNPHIWYDLATMPAVAKSLAAAFESLDPAHQDDYQTRLGRVLASLTPLQAKVADLKTRYTGTLITATEPVFGYMADAIGLMVRNKEFQLAVENDAEPSPGQVAAFENDLKTHAVKVLLYNVQATEDLTKRMQDIARGSNIPVVGVSETEPPGLNYQDWMMSQLVALDKALGGEK